MSKLENIILKYGVAVLDLPNTNDPIGKPVDEAKQEIKDLFNALVDDEVTGTLTHEQLHQRINEL